MRMATFVVKTMAIVVDVYLKLLYTQNHEIKNFEQQSM